MGPSQTPGGWQTLPAAPNFRARFSTKSGQLENKPSECDQFEEFSPDKETSVILPCIIGALIITLTTRF